MRIQAEVSVYPLKEPHLSEPIAQFRDTLASGATPESVMQVVSHATQMAELPAGTYVRVARRGIETFKARDAERPK